MQPPLASAEGHNPSRVEWVMTFEGVSKVFKQDIGKKKQMALNNLTCFFKRGHCTGLLGHNGAGKTTTIRLMLGLVRPDRGQIKFEGRPLSTKAKKKIGYMPEVNKLPHTLTPDEILHHHLRLFAPAFAATTRDRVRAIDQKLDEVGLSSQRHKKVGALSKGERRRLAWAQATIHKPGFLILDEPSSGLDPFGTKRMLDLIEEEKTRDTTIVLCTHELDHVSSLCDDFHLLKKGSLVLTTVKGKSPDQPSDTTHVTMSMVERRVRYNLHLSGADENHLRQLQNRTGLPPWRSYKREGYLSVVGFDEYGQASQWLSACLNEGLVVVRFGDETHVGEDELLNYYS